MKSSKYIKGQDVSSDAFCNTWVYQMNEDLVGRKEANCCIFLFKESK